MNGLTALARGPLAAPTWAGRIAGVLACVVLTVVSQVLGLLLWPVVGLALRSHRPGVSLAVGVLGVGLGSQLLVPLVARPFGRVPLPCLADEALAPLTVGTCLLHRHYVRPRLRSTLDRVSQRVRAEHPRAVVRYLDAGFPFRGMPLLPHLSHHDGRKVDLALMGSGGSPVGYFGYVAPPRAPACPPDPWDLRWDFEALQPWLALQLDDAVMRSLVRVLARDAGVGRVLIEPHLESRLGVRSRKLRFQGCGAARHDDHVHVELAR